MKRQLLVILALLALTSGLLSGCVQEGKIDTPPKPDTRLVEFQQMKLTQLEQANRELADHRAEINETESELERLTNLTREMKAVHRMTVEELAERFAARFQIKGVASKLSQLYEQELPLLTTKQYLEQDIEEIKLYTKLAEYYQFKLSQLGDISARLVELRIDIDQKTLLGGEFASAQQEYNRLLVQRQLLQQDIEQLEQLLEKGLKGAKPL